MTAGTAIEALASLGGIGYDVMAAALGVKVYDAISACTTDPPAFQVLTVPESIALATFDIGSATWSTALAKLNDDVDWALWWVNCECTGAPTMVPPAVPALPAGAPTSEGSGACFSNTVTVTPVQMTAAQFWQPQTDVTPLLIPNLGAAQVGNNVNFHNIAVYPLPQPPPTIRLQSQQTSTTVEQDAKVIYCTGLGANQCFAIPTPVSVLGCAGAQYHDTGYLTFPAGAIYFGIAAVSFGGGWQAGGCAVGPVPMSLTVSLGCGSTLGQTVCCEPKATADYSATLASILQLLQRIGTPQQAYGSLLAGPMTTALTGAGTLAATGAIGVRIDLTTIPARLGQVVGNPTAIFDAGYLTPLTSQGPTESQRIRYQTQVFFFPPTVQAFDYFLEPGVVASATLLDGAP